MVDLQTVCCMCGDVGFPDKLFRCNKCRHRFQHSYCSNYYSELEEPIELCDWCQSEERSSRHGSSSKKSSAGNETGITNRSEYSGTDKIKQHDRDESAEKGKSSGTPSPRPTTRSVNFRQDKDRGLELRIKVSQSVHVDRLVSEHMDAINIEIVNSKAPRNL